MRKRIWGCGIALTVVMGIALWFSSRDYLNLLNRATPIVSVHGWGLERPDIEVSPRIYDLMGGGAQYHLIDYVHWQPDGKTLSFVSNDTLYHRPRKLRTISEP